MPEEEKREEESESEHAEEHKKRMRFRSVDIIALALAAVFIAAAAFLAIRRFSSDDLIFKPISSTPRTLETEWVVNINTASADELMMLDGIGEALAYRIIDYREANGDFETIWDIVEVSGISNNMFNRIYRHITV